VSNPVTRWQRVKVILDDAFELPAEQQHAFVERAAAGDETLRDALELLAADARARGLLESSAADVAAVLGVPAPAAAAAPRTAGPYRLVSLLGEGGMGVVYLAERMDGQFEQRVAVKLLHRDLTDGRLHARFLRERQILARLEHPGIARLLDGGITAEGIPYFALEHVEGRALMRYCEDESLTVESRLLLFLRICDAVAYAHRNLVVHRDLKPSNILVTAGGEPRLLDFGIATLLETDSPEPTTRTVTRLLTPEYAAPEQIRGETVTTATDVYALGVLLYELLAGERPFHHRRSVAALEQALLDEDPVPPSMATLRPSVRLRGDLDAIVMKALRKEPEKRYPAVEALAEEVRRHLTGLPVAARGDARGYRLGKFLRRHRVGMGAAAVVVLALAAGLLGTAWQAGKVQREARRTAEVQRFLLGLFRASDPTEARGQVLSARELLDRGARRAAELGGDPELQARVSSLIGSLYVQLGEYDAAEPLLRQALGLRSRVPAANESAARFADLRALGLVCYQRGDFAQASSISDEAKKLAVATWGEGSLQTATILNWEAWLRRREGRFKEAEALRRRALPTIEALLGPESDEARGARRDLATLLADMGALGEAEAMQRGVLEGDLRRLGPEHPDTLNTRYQLARILVDRERFDEAEHLLRELIPVLRRVLGERHDRVAMSLRMLAWAVEGGGRPAEARPLIEEALAIQRERLGPDDAQVAVSLRRRASIEARLGDVSAAEADAREALRMMVTRFGAVHYDTAACQHELAAILLQRGALPEADELSLRAEDTRRRVLGTDHYQLAATLDLRARILARQGRHDLAAAAANESSAIARRGRR
jgi:serine/threonine-protein kinase